jgi:hypothetical protein
MKWLLETSAKIWECLRNLVTVLRPCRFSAIVVAAGAALLFSAQGLELTVRLPAEGVVKVLCFWVCVFLWSFQSWYWARLILDLTFGNRSAPPQDEEFRSLRSFIEHTPRVLAVGSYVVALVACLFAGYATAWISAGLAIQGALFCVFLVFRQRTIVHRLVSATPGGFRSRMQALLSWRGGEMNLRALPLLSKIILWATLATAAALTVWVCIDAVGFGWFFGAAAVPFLGFSMLVPAGSLLVLWARKGGAGRLAGEPPRLVDTGRGYPVISLLLLLAIAFSFLPWLDNHDVRSLPGDARGSDRPGLDRVFEQWLAQAPRSQDGRANFVVVASAGGGLRAAFWTASVLGSIQDRARNFSRQLFGVSGVSGGSLGAAVFVTLAGQLSLSDGIPGCRGNQEGGAGPFECAGQTVLSQDFLGPAVAALLFPDLMQRFFPFGFPDRARALEQSWERAWARAGLQEDLWRDRGFRSLWAGEGFLPALFLNGTHVETGKRVITSNLDIAAHPTIFRDAYDFYRLVRGGTEIRPSTAAHNSARFTYVSPAGTLADGTHLVDGGYFENFGAVTAREVLKAGIERWGRAIRPVAILISNDPKLKEEDLRPSSQPRPARPRTWAGEVLSPLRALAQTREARGLLAASELRALVEENGGRYFQFRLCEEPGRAEPALGWVLSRDSEELMRAQLRSGTCGNREQMRLLLETLRGG